MNKETIIKKLKGFGYYISNKDDNPILGGIKADYEIVNGYPILNGGFNILFEENKATVIMANSMVPKEGEFFNENDLINFIKQNSPLKK